MINFYADEACTSPINIIEWDNKVNITLFSGEKVEFPNTGTAGTRVVAKVWVRNEDPYIFYVTSISFPDNRVEFTIGSSQLFPNRAVELIISFNVPDNPTIENIVKAGQIKISGYSYIG